MELSLPSGHWYARLGIVLLALLALIAIVRTGLAFALARSNPAFAERVDGGNAAALTALGSKAMLDARDDRDVAEVERVARAAIARSPLESVSLRNVAFVMIASSREREAARLLTLAGRATRRDYLTHAWLLDRNFRENRVAAAIEEADIVLRQNDETWPVVMPALARLVGDRRTTDPLARTLARRPHWRSAFLDTLGREGRDSAATFALFERLRAAGAPADVNELRSYFAANDSLAPAELYRRWAALLPTPLPEGQRLIRDGGFEDLAATGPFNWTFYPQGDVYAEISDAPDRVGKALYLSFDGSQPVSFATQRLMLPAGRYRLAGRLFADGTIGADQIAIAVNCGKSDGGAELARVPLAPRTDRWTPFAFEIAVPARCGAQDLWVLGLPSEALDPATVWLDDLALTPIG